MSDITLNDEEKEILDSFERGEWQPVKDQEKERTRHASYARNTLRKDKRVNIRLSAKDLERLQVIAVEEGIPYQTLMGSILHKYVSERG